jgi:Lrp/AsnC family transcriptional regulator, leucine-responsive regulatory protein
MTAPILLDGADLAVLRLVQRNARLTIEQMALEAGLSSSAIQRRLQRMRETGVILRDIAVIDPTKVGRHMTFLVELELERDRHQLLPQIHSWIAREDAVQQAFYVTGQGDYLLVILVPGVDDFDGLMERMTEQNPNILKFTTSLGLKTLKRGLAVPVP